jgi:tetratricopeptide (TPR) repeat protein
MLAFVPVFPAVRRHPHITCTRPPACMCVQQQGRRPPAGPSVRLAGAVAAALLCLGPAVAGPAAAPAVQLVAALAPAPTPAAGGEAAAADGKALTAMSRRNSRVSGAAAQLYATAKREAAFGNFPAALESYAQLVQAAPSFAPARSNRGNVLVAQGKLAEAIPDYTAALELAPLESDVWVVLVNRGCVYLALGETQSAVDDFNAALARGNGDAAAIYSNRAACFEKLENWDRALRDYQRAVEASAGDVQPWWLRYGLVLFERDRSQDAVGILRRVATRYDAGDVHAALAGVLFARGDVEEAESQWSLVDRPKSFASRAFLEKDRKWAPRIIDAMEEFSTARRARPSADAARR